jgi:hypothetical protein
LQKCRHCAGSSTRSSAHAVAMLSTVNCFHTHPHPTLRQHAQRTCAIWSLLIFFMQWTAGQHVALKKEIVSCMDPMHQHPQPHLCHLELAHKKMRHKKRASLLNRHPAPAPSAHLCHLELAHLDELCAELGACCCAHHA